MEELKLNAKGKEEIQKLADAGEPYPSREEAIAKGWYDGISATSLVLRKKFKVNLDAKAKRLAKIKEQVIDHIKQQTEHNGYAYISVDIDTGILGDALDAIKVADEVCEALEITYQPEPQIPNFIFVVPLI